MMMKKLALATLVAMGMSAAAIAQQPGSQPGSSSSQPQSQPPRNSQPPSQSQTPRQQQPSSQSSAPRGGDRTEQVAFDKADKNSDGKVSRDEANDIDGFDFSRADTNNDASLSRQEYQAAMATSTPRGDSGSARSGDAAPGAGQQRQAQVTFDTADKDKDGKVTRDEASAVPGLNFTSADTNSDASLSRQEFQVAMAGAQPRG
jgi:Ca2+-binding EF-hand superfamily protein